MIILTMNFPSTEVCSSSLEKEVIKDLILFKCKVEKANKKPLEGVIDERQLQCALVQPLMSIC